MVMAAFTPSPVPTHEAPDVVPVRTRRQAFMHQPPAAHDDDAVGHMQQLVQVFTDHQHCRAAVARRHQPRMHFGHGREVQAENRVADQQHLGRVRQLARQHRALHVAARQRSDGRAFALRLDAVGGDEFTRALGQ